MTTAHSGPGLSGGVIDIETTPTEVIPRTNYARSVILQNISGGDIFIGANTTDALETTSGFRLADGESFAADIPPFTEVYAIAASTLPLRYLVFDGVQGF